ncbi:hypothetical protein SARC_05913 [Sphaeroforma arctica JP610]|uniref:Uncharacterized protein n=1 Tax=Sphaeroforma arctica JP610 TaxID=667725 RepID=A0A0L0FYZ9_9EUKA|nr:hypothetical protein SARC_05913 [Sphaeroforma arctica JP610]KNC81791.1 hypothetical protein SARC_05913 [Sphaeroforma arctica JP610]|eukprot:XP_014155693.1 hypothetical protein SARC_05913 [Sphaeroforma arctica JP610]
MPHQTMDALDKVAGGEFVAIGADRAETAVSAVRGPTIASTSKLAFTKPISETRDTSQDAPTNSSDETQKEKSTIIRDKNESQKVPIPEPEEEASSSGKPESTSEITEPTRINDKTSKCDTMAIDVKISLADDRNITTQAVIVKMSQKYDLIVGMSDLLTLGITVTGLPDNIDPLKDQSDDSCETI